MPLLSSNSSSAHHRASGAPLFQRAWAAIATLLALAAIPACATSTAGGTATSSGSGTTTGSSDVGGAGGGSGGGGQGGQGTTPICGDGLIATTESCDDGNTASGDGCDSQCAFETPGWDCSGAPTVCAPKCGDGFVVGNEACDDGNSKKSDGCSDTCTIDNGYACSGAPSLCVTVCGDGILAGAEQCDDHNTSTLDGCNDACKVETGWTCVGQPSQCLTSCGDGVLAGAEQCDDHNFLPGDGCSDACAVEPFYTCTGAPSACATPCGDGHVVGAEQCDDSNLLDGDGCNAVCKPEPGYACSGTPSKCVTVCGDGVRSGTEACDDGNVVNGDGCNAVCKVEPGFTCAGTTPTLCKTTCGDGYPAGSETCDDGNLVNGDGCDSACHAEHGYSCNNFPSVCQTVCGDGAIAGNEQCDDGNTIGGDGCSPTCGKMQGYTCTGEPSVCVPKCGDGIVAGNEQCDDGNLVNGDCCSATCAAEAGCEIEPNDVLSTANVFSTLAIGGTVKGTIKPATDLDVYSISIPAGKTAVITATTLDGFNSTCVSQALDSYITVYDAEGSSIISADGGGGGKCAAVQAAGLQGGDYFVEVKAGSATTFSYAVSIQVQITVCGNGTKEPGEQCDDGNTAAGDGCSALCAIEVVSEVEPNNTVAQAAASPVQLAGDGLFVASIGTVGDKDVFKVTVATPSVVRFETFQTMYDCGTIATTLRLLDSGGVALKVDTPSLDTVASGIKSCAALVVALAPGTYYIQAEQTGNSAAIATYYLQMKLETDLGNEVEPNNLQAQATSTSGADFYLYGDHQTAADIDYYAITVPAGASIRAETVESNAVTTCESNAIDSYLTLYSPSASSLVTDDDDGRGYCSAIDGTGAAPRDAGAHNLAAGTYYLQVKAAPLATAQASIFNYRLVVTVR